MSPLRRRCTRYRPGPATSAGATYKSYTKASAFERMAVNIRRRDDIRASRHLISVRVIKCSAQQCELSEQPRRSVPNAVGAMIARYARGVWRGTTRRRPREWQSRTGPVPVRPTGGLDVRQDVPRRTGGRTEGSPTRKRSGGSLLHGRNTVRVQGRPGGRDGTPHGAPKFFRINELDG